MIDFPQFLSRKLPPADRDAAFAPLRTHFAALVESAKHSPSQAADGEAMAIRRGRERDAQAGAAIVASMDAAERKAVGEQLIARGFAKPGYAPKATKGTRKRAELLAAVTERAAA